MLCLLRETWLYFSVMQSRSWSDIEAHYLNLNRNGWKHERFMELINHIKSLALSKRLYATTSLDTLLISIYDPIEWHFDYYAVPHQKPECSRIYVADMGINKFDNFIQIIGW